MRRSIGILPGTSSDVSNILSNGIVWLRICTPVVSTLEPRKAVSVITAVSKAICIAFSKDCKLFAIAAMSSKYIMLS